MSTNTSNLKTCNEKLEPIWKLLGDEQSADQSIRNTHSDQPSNLIPHDKDHVGDPCSFVLIFHSESTWIEIFQ
jgi:hypothetical protein